MHISTELLKNPPASHRNQPLWVWNADVDKTHIKERLELYKEQGIGGAFVHARPGLITEYLGEAWFELWAYASEVAESLGLELHVYDENTYPSGFAGGHVAHELGDVATMRYLKTHTIAAEDSPSVAGKVVASLPADSGKLLVIEEVKSESEAWLGGFPFVDSSNPETTQAFIRSTHDAYAKRFGEKLGKSLKYFFFDEPELAFHLDGIPFTKTICKHFEDHRGYRFEDKLADFYLETAESPKVRYDYYLTLHEVWLKNFVEPLCNWADKHGVAITGHEMEHCWPDPTKHATIMSVYKRMQVPGIDLLGFQYKHGDTKNNALLLLGIKELDSVANQFDKERTLCEMHGGGGFSYDLEDAKNMSDWAMLHGVNLVCEHISVQSITGHRKYDFPQVFSEQSPWMESYRVVADHNARLSYLLTRGKQVNRVLVLQPCTSVWMDMFKPDQSPSANILTPYAQALQTSQSEFILKLTQALVDFDLGDEFVMQESAKVRAEKLVVGSCAYSHFVIPPLTRNLTQSTVDLLKQFLSSGGHVYEVSKQLDCVDGQTAPEVIASLRIHNNWHCETKVEKVISELKEALPKRFELIGADKLPDNVYLRRVQYNDEQCLYFIANSSTKKQSFKIRCEHTYLSEIDTLKGTIAAIPTSDNTYTCTLPAGGHQVLLTSAQKPEAEQANPPSTFKQTLSVDCFDTIEPVAQNIAVVPFCDLHVQGKTHTDCYAPTAAEMAWKAQGLTAPPGYWAVEFKGNLFGQKVPEDGSFACDYHFEIDPSLDASKLEAIELAVEWADLYALSLNGQPLCLNEKTSWLDCRIYKLSTNKLLKHGKNTLSLQCKPLDTRAQIAPIYLLGDFHVKPADKGFVLTAAQPLQPGDWTAQGMPFYHRQVAYTKTFTVQETSEHIQIKLPELNGSFANVSVDDEHLGVIAFQPYTLEAAKSLQPGEHTLKIEIMGNLQNLLGPHFKSGVPVLWFWQDGSDGNPSGKQYNFAPMGLQAVDIKLG